MENPIYQVKEKAKSGYVIIIDGAETLVPNAEFKKVYKLSKDGTTCTMNEAYFKRLKQNSELLDKCVTLLLFLEQHKITNDVLLTLGQPKNPTDKHVAMQALALSIATEKLAKNLGVTNDEAVKLVKERYEYVMQSEDKDMLLGMIANKKRGG
jgi:hypothetical protein